MTDTRITQELRQAVEAILMVSDQPVEATMMAQLLDLKAEDIDQVCHDLAAEYRSEQRGFMLAKVAGGYRYQTNPELAPYVERYVLEGQSARLSAAALETLAIVAYKQPISRLQVGAIRGVTSDGVLRTLENRGYVAEIERDAGPGNAILYGTTPLFLERLGIDSLSELPPLADFMPETAVVEALEGTLRPSEIDPRDLDDEPLSAPDPTDVIDLEEGELVEASEPATNPGESDTAHDDVIDVEATDVDPATIDNEAEIIDLRPTPIDPS